MAQVHMNIVVTTKRITEANAVTHGGVFHADEVMATAILALLQPLTVCRTFSVPEDLNPETLVYDIGRGMYDHHQRGGNGARPNGVRYAACGLIWRAFGPQVIQAAAPALDGAARESVWLGLDHGLMEEIDAADNGELPASGALGTRTGISSLISAFNPAWDSQEDSDASFLRAVETAGTVLCNAVDNAVSLENARQLVTEAIDAAREGILILPCFAPWRGFLEASSNPRAKEILFVVFPSVRGGYSCQCVPKEGDGFSQRKPLPTAWRGQPRERLRELTGVKTAEFCHPAGFICGAETLEDTLALARLAAETKEAAAIEAAGTKEKADTGKGNATPDAN